MKILNSIKWRIVFRDIYKVKKIYKSKTTNSLENFINSDN